MLTSNADLLIFYFYITRNQKSLWKGKFKEKITFKSFTDSISTMPRSRNWQNSNSNKHVLNCFLHWFFSEICSFLFDKYWQGSNWILIQLLLFCSDNCFPNVIHMNVCNTNAFLIWLLILPDLDLRKLIMRWLLSSELLVLIQINLVRSNCKSSLAPSVLNSLC